MKRLLALVAAGTVAIGPSATGADVAAPAASELRAPAKQVLSHGPDRLQRIDFWAGRGRDAPLVMFVHGGGWKRGDKRMMDGSAKLSHWQSLGYAVASVNYRLVPDHAVEDQAADIATAVAHLKANAPRLGIDGKRIALVGHSAGAHLVALVGTDPAYFQAAGLAPGDVRGIVPLDGACYDVPAQIADAGRLMRKTYVQAFGTDPARQRRLSPTHHAAAPNAPEFLILHVDRDDGARQSEALAAALRRAGTPVRVRGFDGRGLRGHRDINRELGKADYPATPVVADFLAQIFA